MKFFSKSKNGFFCKEIHGDFIPEDAVEISDEYYFNLLDGQANLKKIVSDKNGYPSLEKI